MLVTVGLIGLFTVTQDVTAVGPTDIAGVINSNATWTAANSPYIIKKNTTVMQDYTLTIQAGTIVKFENNTRLNIRGKLSVLGNSTNRVVFTANGTKYNYSVESVIDGKKNWYHGSGVNYSIFTDVWNGGETNIFYAKFEYSTDYVLTSNYRLHTSKEIIINDTLFENNKWCISPGWVNYIINRCSFENNFAGIYNIEPIHVWYYTEIYDSVFKNNTYGIYSDKEVNKKYTIERSSFNNNFAGIYDLYGYPEIFDSNFENNTFGVYSGAEVYNCSFRRNYFGARMGYSESIIYPRIYVRFSTFTNNDVGFHGYLSAKNSFISNKVGVISTAGDSIANNNICNNTDYNLKFLYGYTDWSFSGNWWGTTNTSTIDKYIFDVWDEANLYEAKYKPILTSPVNITPTPPVAVAGPNQNVTTNQVVYFDATGSYDSDMDELLHKWDFGDGNESVWAYVSYKLSHIYTVPGNYTATLSVTDAMFTDTDTCIIHVNSPPVADAGPYQNVKVDQVVMFDGNKSYDPDGDTLTYKWDFGDGNSTDWQSQSNTSHIYKKLPIILPWFTVTLTVSDGFLTDTDTCTVRVTVNSAPVADAGPNQYGKVDQDVIFDGTTSYDQDGDKLTYKWDFGDGNSTNWLNQSNTSHAYNKSGYYNVTLTVSDGFSTDTDICSVSITEAKVNRAPVADAGPNLNGTVYQNITFDASNSYDPDGDTLTYRWYFGDYKQSGWISSSTTTHSYNNEKNYTAILEVFDGQLNDTDTCVVSIKAQSGNQAPVASAGIDQNVTVNQTVNFNGAGSSDPNNDPLSFRWYFGDGSFTGWENISTAQHTYTTTGFYNVTLIVSDGLLTDSDECYINVMVPEKNNSAPVANAGSDQYVKVWQKVDFDGGNSYDPDNDPLKYQWKYGDGGSTGWLTSSKTSHYYSKSGNFTVTLTVSDGSLTDSDTCMVHVSTANQSNSPPVANAGPDQFVFVNDTVYFNGSGSFDTDNDPLTYRWFFGDGMTTGWKTTFYTTHKYYNASVYNVTLTVSDGKATDSDSCLIIVNKSGNSSSQMFKDSDGDGFNDNDDRFPFNPNEWNDTDDDGFGDNTDEFPEDETQWKDTDSDGYGDSISGNSADLFPDDPNEWADFDRDGIGDNSDKFPFDSTEWKDSDDDGIGDNSDIYDDKKFPINDKIISNAVNKGDICVVVSIDDFGQDVIDFKLSGIEIELISVSKNLIEFLIRGDLDIGKVVVLNIHKDYEFTLDYMDNIIVNLDSISLQHALFGSVLSANGEVGLYCVSLGNDGIQILIYIPQFSEHTVTIEKIQYDTPKSNSDDIHWSSIIILMIGIILIICILVIVQIIRKKGVLKKSDELSFSDDDSFTDDYESIPSNYDFLKSSQHKEYPLKDIYFNGYDEQNTNNTYKQETNYGNEKPEQYITSVRRTGGSFKTSHRMKKVISRNRESQLGALVSELIRKRGTRDFKYSHSELLSLLEGKYQRGKVSEETYQLLKDDIECLED
jgi:PKD repeat protein